MTSGFQQQQQSSFTFPRTVRQPQQVGSRLDTAPTPPNETPAVLGEPRSFADEDQRAEL